MMVLDMVFKKKILSTFSDLRELENDFKSFLEINRVPNDIIYDLRMAVHEYLLNVMEHGYHWVGDNEIEFEAKMIKKDKNYEITIVVQDHAPKFELSKDKIIKSVNSKSFRGRGLLMILTFLDDIEYDHSYNKGNRVIMKKSFQIRSK